MNVAEYIVEVLVNHGVKHVYGYPGAALLPLMYAIDKNPNIKWILMRHEGSAALAASAASKLTGNIQVCMGTTGPGALNLITGVADAHYDRTPLLVITGQHPTSKLSLTGFQNVAQKETFDSFLPLSKEIKYSNLTPGIIHQCISNAENKREAVHLEIAKDIQESEIIISNVTEISKVDVPETFYKRTTINIEQIYQASNLIKQHDKVLIIVGTGAKGVGESIENLSNLLSIPILSTLRGKGIINEAHRNYIGVCGIFGHDTLDIVTQTINESTLIINIGVTNPSSIVCNEQGIQLRDLIEIHPNITYLNFSLYRKFALFGNINSCVNELKNCFKFYEPSAKTVKRMTKLRENYNLELHEYSALKETDPGEGVHPAVLMEILSSLLSENNLILADTGDNTLWLVHFLHLNQRQTVIASDKMGAMGFCLNGLIAAKLERPDLQAIGICGDGSFQMVMGEICTAVQYNLSLVLIVLENGLLQRVVPWKDYPVGVELYNPDIAAVAKHCGANSVYIKNNSEILGMLKEALNYKEGPTIVHVKTNPDVFTPHGSSKK